jgi:hypothetical protein
MEAPPADRDELTGETMNVRCQMRFALAMLVLSSVAACTDQQLYNSSQGWREAECNKMIDTPRRERCMKEARQSYEEYRKP